jgi:hypothetical protein
VLTAASWVLTAASWAVSVLLVDDRFETALQSDDVAVARLVRALLVSWWKPVKVTVLAKWKPAP